jgi:hypothetical protein
MKDKSEIPPLARRKFFGLVAGAAAAGIVIGNIGRCFVPRRKKAAAEQQQSITVHPLAVPRSREGGHSNG